MWKLSLVNREVFRRSVQVCNNESLFQYEDFFKQTNELEKEKKTEKKEIHRYWEQQIREKGKGIQAGLLSRG